MDFLSLLSGGLLTQAGADSVNTIDTTPKQPATLLCTDEDIWVHAPSDFGLLTPASQQVASGADGTFDPSDRWTLTSPTVNFEAYGVVANNIVLLSTPKGVFGGAGQFLAVNSVSGNSVTLRRPYKPLGVGMPPSPADGLTSVTFAVNTLAPQISEATYDLYQRFGLDENVAARGIQRSPGYVYDLQVFRAACVYEVLLERYTVEGRSTAGDFSLKIARFTTKLNDAINRITVAFGPTGASTESTTVFSARLLR